MRLINGCIYQSATGISAGTNKRTMRNLMPPAPALLMTNKGNDYDMTKKIE